MLSEIQNLTTRLQDNGINALCCGGAARDYLHMRQPKDFDFIVMGGSQVYGAYTEACRAAGIEVLDVTQGYEDADGNVQDGILWVVKGKLSGLGAVDIICREDFPETPIAIVEAFDCSLNMAWFEAYRGKLIVRTAEGYPSVAFDVPNEELKPGLDPSRLQKLREAFPEYRHLPY